MPELIIQTRILPPKGPSNIIHRERLLNLLSSNLDKNIILVCAPAGYGKTTVVQDFLDTSRINYAWLHASADINSLYTFFGYLVHSLKQLNRQFGESTIQILEAVRQEEKRFQGLDNVIEEISGNFINDFCKHFPGDTYQVIDDLHNLRNHEWVKLVFNSLIENLPQNLHFIITTRTVPEFSLTKPEAKRNLAQIQPNELNFTKAEIAALLSNVYSMKYSDDDLEFLEDNLHGWITGIHLIIQAYGENFGKAAFKKEAVPENIFNFFADEIFEKLDSNTQEFLLNTAMLDVIDPAVCDALLNFRKSGQIINGLLNKNIFIQPVQGTRLAPSVNYFSYPDLFRKFLVSKLHEAKSRTEIKLLLAKFYEYYLEKDDAESAIRFCLLGEEYDTAVPLIKKMFPSYFEQGEFETLWKWIEPLSEDILTRYPELVYFKGLLYKYYLGNIEDSLNHIQKAIDLLENEGTKEPLINCQITKAEVLLNLGKNQEVLNILSRLAEVPTSPENRAKILYFLAFSHFMNSEYDIALEQSNKSLEICGEHDLKDIQLDNFTVLGNIYINRGEYFKATYYYEKIIEKSPNLFKKYLSLCNLVLVCSRSGKFEKAREYISRAEELLNRFVTPIFENAFLLANFSLSYDAGDFEKSIELLGKINRIARKLERKDYISLSYEQLSETYYYLNELNKAKEYLNISKDYLDEKNKTNIIDFNFLDALMRKKSGENGKIEETLLGSLSFCSDNMFFENQAKIGYHLADYYLRTGMGDTAAKYLRDSLKIGSDKEYISYFQREFIDSRILFDYAIENNIEKSFVKALVDSLTERTNFDWLSEECKKRIGKEVDNLYDINIECFGGLEFKIRGKKIPEDKWIRKKRKLVLAYLLLHPGVQLTKDRIIDLFYPDTPTESTDNIFHQTVSNIRSVLKISDSETGKKSKREKSRSKVTRLPHEPQFIIYEDKILRLNPDYTYRVDAFEFKRLCNSAYAPGITLQNKEELIRRAIDLYRGELLTGHYDQWCEDLRQDYQNTYIKLIEDVIEIVKSRKMHNDVIQYSKRLLKTDKLSENAYLNIIDAYVNLDNIDRARERFSQMLRTFDEELGEKPSPGTLEKIKHLLS